MNRTMKLLTCLLAICIIAAIVPVNVHAAGDGGQCGDNLTWYFDGKETLTISGTGPMWNYDPYDRNPAPWTDYYEYLIKKVVISDGVTTIGDSAFAIMNFTEVTIPDSVTRIGDYAFGECISLSSIRIPDSVTYLGVEAFWGCHTLTEVTLSRGITKINLGTFTECFQLKTMDIPNSVRTIDDYAF